MKKYLFYFLSLFTFALTFTACSSDDDESDSGNKMSYKSVTRILTSTMWKNISWKGPVSPYYLDYLKFMSDGKCYVYDNTYSIKNDIKEVKTWTYSEDSQTLRLYGGDYYTYHFDLEIEDNGDWVGTDNTGSTPKVGIFTPYKEDIED